MEQILLSSNADFVALLLNGFVGVQLIFVRNAINYRLMVFMSQGKRKMN
jgi:hypothetical protein